MKTVLERNINWALGFVAICIVSLYWGGVASDRYVSESNVVLESPQVASPSVSFQSLISGGGGSNDMLLMRDYLLSVDMMLKLDAELDLKGHFSNTSIDFISRMGSDVTIEEFHDYYLTRVSIELDEYAQILRFRIEAFDPDMSKKMADYLIFEGESYMNKMGQRLAEEQVKFLERQVEKLNLKFVEDQNALINYQNLYGLVSPTDTLISVEAVATTMESELAKLKAKKIQLLSYQSSSSPRVIEVNSKINAIQQQITEERSRVIKKTGSALNEQSAEYAALELKAQFSQNSYSLALAALENTRIEAARKLKQVSVLQKPTLPEYAIEPRRLYNSAVFAVVVIFLGLITQMLILIVRDHRD